MDSFRNGWFTETGVLNSDYVNISIKYSKLLYSQQSKFQKILVFDSPKFGKCLVLDDAIQCTENDEFSYQESIAFLPLNSHPDPKKVLIIGGGDGGVAREVLKHPLVEQVTLCEIDEEVVNVSKKFFPSLSCAFDNPKLNVVIEDGTKFVANHKNTFDVIICDSSDPIGPAQCLFEQSYYNAMREALKDGGIICCQAESYWFDLKLVVSMFKMAKQLFKCVEYASISIPTYPAGQIGFLIACKDKEVNFSEPLHTFSNKQQTQMALKYYSANIHRSSFVLPPFICEALHNC
ncbi:Spermidine synthase-like protein [Leptotrombidium deliense]|uniref:Spermidine synthase-like protein n=1 Tax=Leptotrombidium deliense TaxID=299467 RepID=A0A443S7S3_9ACAR|nr:Spermidine synthase-like protein [Leptotrombidium deliense]